MRILTGFGLVLIVGLAQISFANDLAQSPQSSDLQKWLADRHVERGNGECASCHPTQLSADVSSETCLKCHGSYADLANKTSKGNINPHDNHMGEQPCTVCHQGHKPPQLICDGCHEFSMRVP